MAFRSKSIGFRARRRWVPLLLIGVSLTAAGACAATPSAKPTAKVVNCTDGQACSVAISSSDGTTEKVDEDPGSPGTVSLSVDSGPSLDCSGYEGIDVHTFDLNDNTGDRQKTLTLTIPWDGKVNADVDPLEICFGSPNKFYVATDEPAPFNPVTNEYEGLLWACKYDTPQSTDPINAPCLVPTTLPATGPITLQAVLPPGDPRTK
jgi:hypothetical protein